MRLRFLALGDSYTIGEGVAPSERWPVQLVSLLRARGLDAAVPEIVAATGWTTDELLAAIHAARPECQYDLVSLLIGVNNQYRGRSVEEYREQFRALLRLAVGFARGQPGRVLVLSVPDWGATPFAAGRDRRKIAAEIDRFNSANRDEARRAGVRYAGVTEVSQRAGREPDLVSGDGLHPSGAMYRLWAELALPEALAALASPKKES